ARSNRCISARPVPARHVARVRRGGIAAGRLQRAFRCQPPPLSASPSGNWAQSGPWGSTPWVLALLSRGGGGVPASAPSHAVTPSLGHGRSGPRSPTITPAEPVY